MSTSEERVDDSLVESLIGAASEGAEIVGVSVDDDAGVIVEAINRFLQPPKKKGWLSKPKVDSNIDNWTDRALPIGRVRSTPCALNPRIFINFADRIGLS